MWHLFPDGGAVFPSTDPTNKDGWVYVSNSEVYNEIPILSAILDIFELIDIDLHGGVGALEFNATGDLISMRRICDQTNNNCAGGQTPWATWLTCEEINDGQVYECDPMGTPETQKQLPALGRFAHEVVAVDMETRTVYLTEDASDGRLYRFVSQGIIASDYDPSKDALDLHNGTLQVLEIEGFEDGEYIDDINVARQIHRVKWVDVIDPHRPQSEVRNDHEGYSPGTRFNGGEGIWIHQFEQPIEVPGSAQPLRAVIYFASKGDNRIYAYDIDNDWIEVVFDNTNSEQIDTNLFKAFDDVDNVVVSPAGDVVIAEDGEEMRLMLWYPMDPLEYWCRCPTAVAS